MCLKRGGRPTAVSSHSLKLAALHREKDLHTLAGRASCGRIIQAPVFLHVPQLRERYHFRRPLVSSPAMRSVGYDQASNVLEIEFPGGEVYGYLAVPPDVHRGLMTAKSAGRYFHQRIRGVYEYERVE